MLDGISVIAFDIDGTLYPSFSFYLKIFPYFLRNFRFFLKFNAVRKILHRTALLPDFYEYQARIFAGKNGGSASDVKERIQKIVYDGMKPYFDRTKPFPGVKECFQKIHEAGYKIALLSDFPPSQKGATWGVLPYCDVVLGSEECGALKPSKYPFGVMAQKLGVPLNEILYVGNSVKCDIVGAKNAGMKSAYILPLWRKILHLPHKLADINFSNYRQFSDIVIK